MVFGLAAVAQARAVRGRTPGRDLRGFVTVALGNPLLLAVVAAYLVGFLLHAVAIVLLPLYLAQASISLSLPVTALASRHLGEGLRGRQWLGVAAVVGGLVLLALGCGEPGEPRTIWWFPGALGLGLLALLLCGRAADRLSGAALGWLAGLGYAGSAIAVRGVAWPPSSAVAAAAALVPLFGLVAFWLYSLGLERRVVATSTAPLITTQTFVPALVGLALLGDGVRDGWSAAVVAGLVLAVAGSAVVVDEDPRAGGA